MFQNSCVVGPWGGREGKKKVHLLAIIGLHIGGDTDEEKRIGGV